VGANSGWVITDNATGTILALPPAPPFDLEGAGDGVCDIWYIRYEDGLTGLMTGQNVSGLVGCYDLSNPISVTRNDPDAAAIEITGTGQTEVEICAGDGVGDPIDVTVVGTGVGANSGWVITDNATGTILALPPAPPFDLEGAGNGVCDIWYIRYEDGLTGLNTGANVADLVGCFDFSNPISVDRQGVDAAAIEITGTGATSIDICAGDGIGDPIDVTIVGTSVGTNGGWVITDNATGQILALPPAPPFDLEGAGDGVCDIWYIRYEDGLTGLSTGQNVADLMGCYDLSNPISVNREGVDAPPIFITGSPGNTEITICAGDGVGNPINITVDGTGIGDNSGWVITDNATGEILALPPAPPFDLDGAGPGVCDIWYIRYATGLSGLAVGEDVADLEGCFDLSNPVRVNRQGVDAAAIEITGTGATEIDICAGDGIDDPIDVTLVGTGEGSFNGWVITDNATGTILGLPAAPPFNLEGAGAGICDIWYIRYESGLIGLNLGENVADLVGCYDLSNPIQVNREGVDGAAIQIAGTTDTEVSICAGDGEADPIEVEIVGTGVGANNGWVITDNATGEILALPPAPPFDLDGAGPGVCDIWYIRYADGLTGLETGLNVADLDGCFDLSNPISVTRLTGDDCDILSTDEFQTTFEFALFPNPANDMVSISFLGGRSVNAEVAVYDITGRLVAQHKFDAQTEVNLDVSSLNSGTYLVQIQDSETGSNTTKQLIKR
ncbi:MAG: T9SS type A sorting domain-containing protein, partial [Flavobacteriaceae bacterium]|nr:T9SS type A sorting domain-containing protein [Flavobacteriaceae bacterium]